ncbi:hypothetical protein [Arthrobacter sp. 260]|nr:hypothetical protein [Arthrobacter sp. 260]NOJ60301.1 hypothetical protein [Arthrobacter sp. 260]
MKAQTIIALKADFPLPVRLQVTGLARSTFFYHPRRASKHPIGTRR